MRCMRACGRPGSRAAEVRAGRRDPASSWAGRPAVCHPGRRRTSRPQQYRLRSAHLEAGKAGWTPAAAWSRDAGRILGSKARWPISTRPPSCHHAAATDSRKAPPAKPATIPEANINMRFAASGKLQPELQARLRFDIQDSSYDRLPMSGSGTPAAGGQARRRQRRAAIGRRQPGQPSRAASARPASSWRSPSMRPPSTGSASAWPACCKLQGHAGGHAGTAAGAADIQGERAWLSATTGRRRSAARPHPRRSRHRPACAPDQTRR